MYQSCRLPFHRIGRYAMVAAACLALAIPGRADSRAVKVKVAPVYPEMAKRLQLSGTVTVQATVEANGSVSDVKTVSGNHMLSPAAETAVRKWKFESAAEKTTVNIDIVFAM